MTGRAPRALLSPVFRLVGPDAPSDVSIGTNPGRPSHRITPGGPDWSGLFTATNAVRGYRQHTG